MGSVPAHLSSSSKSDHPSSSSEPDHPPSFSEPDLTSQDDTFSILNTT